MTHIAPFGTQTTVSVNPMHPSQDDIRRAGIRVDEDVLDRLTGQLHALQHTRQQIMAAILQSQAALDAVEHELRDTVQRRDDLQATVRRKRTALVRRPFMELPMDPLHCIYEHLAAAHMADGEWVEVVPLGKRKLNRDRVTAAYTVAAVCRHWRVAALALPALWSYIGVGCFPSASAKAAKWARLAAGVRTLLVRSKAAPLDIFLDWHDADDVNNANAQYDTVLDHLSEHAARWRSFELRCIRVGVPLQWLDVFRAPTPLLEELSILSQQDSEMPWKSPYPRYLPVAPKLHSLYIEHCPLISTAGLPALAVLDIWLTTLPAERAWDILLGCPSLQSLLLGCRPLDLGRGPPGDVDAVALPALQTLELHGLVEPLFVSHGARLVLPKLSELCLFGHMVDPLRSFFAQSCGATVQSLVVFTGTLDAASAESLRALGTLQNVKFVECTLTDAFVRALALEEDPVTPPSATALANAAAGPPLLSLSPPVEQRPPMWPELKRLELEKVELVPTDTMDTLVRMLRVRNLGSHHRGASQMVLAGEADKPRRVHPIQEFVFDEVSLNKWVAAEIRYIMDVSVARITEVDI